MMPSVYIDSCGLIEALKGRAGLAVEHPDEAVAVEQVLRASRDGVFQAWTSTLTIAEVLHLGAQPPTSDVKALIERLLLSGRDGIQLVQPTPLVAIKARDLTWNHGLLERAMDRLHIASALSIEASELLTLDGRLAKKFGASSIQGCELVAARDCKELPDEYKTQDLFGP